MMNWNKKDVNTKTETEQETQKPVKEDRKLGLLYPHAVLTGKRRGRGSAGCSSWDLAICPLAAAVTTRCSS